MNGGTLPGWCPSSPLGRDLDKRSLLYIVQILQGHELQTTEHDDLDDHNNHPLQPLLVSESGVREEEVLEERITRTLAQVIDNGLHGMVVRADWEDHLDKIGGLRLRDEEAVAEQANSERC